MVRLGVLHPKLLKVVRITARARSRERWKVEYRVSSEADSELLRHVSYPRGSREILP